MIYKHTHTHTQHTATMDDAKIWVFFHALQAKATVKLKHIECKLRSKNHHQSTDGFGANITVFGYNLFAKQNEMVLMLSHRTQYLIRKMKK